MPISKPSLDLEAWGKFLPQERPDDYEYNLLLYKFKSFLHEVVDFHDRHKNCSVTKAETFTTPEAASKSSAQRQSTRAFILASAPPSTNIIIKSQQHQLTSTVPTASSNLANAQQQQQQQQQVVDKQAYLKHQHSSPAFVTRDDSSKNGLASDSTCTLDGSESVSSNSINRPQVKLRSQMTYDMESSHIDQVSKSTERLEMLTRIANESERFSSSMIDERASSKVNSFSVPRHNIEPKARASDGLGNGHQDDEDIYDAVSPDDLDRGLDLAPRPRPPSNHFRPPVSSIKRPHAIPGSKHDNNNKVGLKSSSAFEPIQTNSRGNADVTSRSFLYQGSSINSLSGDNSFEFPKLTKCQFNASSLQSDSMNESNNSNLQRSHDQDEYSSYVNIDFFLKRSHRPSIDCLNGGRDKAVADDDDDEGSFDEEGDHENSDDDEDDDHDHDEETEDEESGDDGSCQTSDMNNQIENLRELSPLELARKLSSKVDKSSSSSSTSSITPSSSGESLNEPRSTSMIYQPSSSSTSADKQLDTSLNAKVASYSSMTSNDSENSRSQSKNPVLSQDNKNNKPYQTLWPINEKKACFKQSISLDQSNGLPTSGSGNALVEAHNTMRSFMSDLNLSSAKDVFEDKAQRRIVKESFAVEYSGRRKLRHLFLFNDVIVCAKYQASPKQKFTFDVKWYLNLNGVSIADSDDPSNQAKNDKESNEGQILEIRAELIKVRDEMQRMKRSKHKQPSKKIKKLKKKRTQLEAKLVLLLPHLPLVIKHINGKKYTFFLSSNFDRNQWIESIKFLQSQLPPAKGHISSASSSELQAWIETCRNLNPSLGTFLLRSNGDEDLLHGDLYLHLNCVNGITKPGKYYCCFEVDSYGHFSQKATSSVFRVDNANHKLSEEYIFPLDGAHTLRVLIYEDLGINMKPSMIGKAQIELSHCCHLDKSVERSMMIGNSNCSLMAQFSYISSELLSIRIEHAKFCPTFGLDITQVCKREKTNVPMIIQLCINEVERRGMREVGIYRMSGTSTDIQKLKKAFETNLQTAELLLRDIDINSVTCFLKTYLREIPEGLFSNKLYLKFVAAFNISQSDQLERTKTMLELFKKIPFNNQQTIIYLVEHLVKLNKYEAYNKMSLTNLATVLGPNILKAPTESPGPNSSDPFTAVVIGSMSQAGILYFFLNRRYSNLPLADLDSSEQADTRKQ